MLIQLNARDYVVVPRKVRRNGRDILVPVEEYDVELFTDSFDTLGGQSQERIGPYTTKIVPNLSHGFGRNRIASDSARNPDEYRRFYDSTGDTRWPGDIYLPIQSESTIHSGLEVLRWMTDFKANVWGLFEDATSADLVSRTMDGATLTWGGGGTIITGATSVGLDLQPHKASMIALYASTNDHIAEFSTDGVTWTAATTAITVNLLSDSVSANEDIDAGLLETVGGEMVAVIWHESNGTITFFSSTDSGANWTDEAVDIASGNGPQGVAVLPGLDNEDKLYVCTREGLYEVDTAPATWTTRKIFSLTPHNNNGRRMAVHSDGALWFSQGVGDSGIPVTYRMFISSAGIRDIRPVPNDFSDGDGVVAEMLGPIRAMTSSGGFLYASLGGGAASRQARIVCHNGSGWHSMHRHAVADQEIEPIHVTGEDDGNERLLFGIRTATDVTEIKFLGNSNANPQSGVSINRENSGYIDLPFMDGGMPLIPAAWLRFGINASSLSSDNTGEFIQMTYGLNRAARTTSPATAFEFVSGTLTQDLPSGATAGAGESARNIGTRITLNRDNSAVAFDAASSGSDSASTTVTVSHTTGSGSNRALIVGVSCNHTVEARAIPTGVTYDGSAMTLFGSATRSGTGANFIGVSLWYIKAPSTGANDIVATFTSVVKEAVVGGVSVTGARQDPPTGVAVLDDNAASTSASITLLSGPDDLVIDVLSLDSEGVSQTATVGASQTSRWNTDDDDILGAGSTESGADGTTTMSWSSFTNARENLLMAAVISAVGDTDTPELEDVEINYLKIPSTLEGYIFTVDVAQTANRQATKPEAVITRLKAARDLGTLPVLVYGPSGSRYVKVRNVRWRPEVTEGSASGASAPDVLMQRGGYVDVVCEEVV